MWQYLLRAPKLQFVNSLFLVRRMILAAGAVTAVMVLGLWFTQKGPEPKPQRPVAHRPTCAQMAQMFGVIGPCRR